MKTYEVKFKADKTTASIIVTASDSSSARRVALGKIQGQYGYIGKKITITSTREIK